MNLDPQQLLRRWLAEDLAAGLKKNPAYSLRAMAKKLRISSAALSEIFAAKRRLSERRALQIIAMTSAADSRKSALQKAFASFRHLKKLDRQSGPLEEDVLPREFFDLMADWRYFAVVGVMRAEEVSADVNGLRHLAARLSLTEAVAKKLTQRLLKSGMIEASPRGVYVSANRVFRTPSDYPEKLMKQREIASLKNAAAALKNPRRLHSSGFSTISGDAKKFPEAMAMLEEFLKRLSVFLSDGDRNEVFELSMHLSTLTNLKPAATPNARTSDKMKPSNNE